MNRRNIWALVIGAGVIGALGGAAATRGGAAPQPEPPKMSKDEIAKMMETAAAPVEEHKLLDHFVGPFDLKGTFNMGPGLEMGWESSGSGKKIIGGRFVEVDAAGKPDAKPFIESKMIMGFDTRTKKYTLWGIDSMGTYSISAEGDYNVETKTLELLGSVNEHGRNVNFKQVFKLADPDRHEVQILFEMEPGNWAKVVDMVSTRRK